MNKQIVLTGATLICLAILIGAFGAHAVRERISADLLHSWETGTTYQFYAGFGMLIIGLTARQFKFSLRPFYLLNLLGVILFSLGIYLYCFHEMVPALKPAVHFVPIGGFAYILAWVFFIIGILRQKTSENSPGE